MSFPDRGKMKLGFGLMRLPRLEDGKTIDIPQCCEMVDRFMEAGGWYFDTAFVYTGSEEAAREALVSRYPRDSYVLATKVNALLMCKNAEEAKKQIDISLERTGAGYFDCYLHHALDRSRELLSERYGLWDHIRRLKEEGKIRHYGFSFHDSPEVLDELLTKHPDTEFVQLQINYADWEDSGVLARRCYEVAEQHGKPVIVMEPVKGGMLAAPPESVGSVLREADPDASPSSWAIRFAASLPNVAVVLSGMSNIAQMEDNLSYMKDFKPLSGEEQEVIRRAQEALYKLDRISCTGCSYCTSGCPMEISIPNVFSSMNQYLMYDRLDRAKRNYELRAGEAKASDCVACGQCESVCPQHLPIIRLLKEAAEVLET